MVGSGMGAKNHILFKNAESIEETGKIDFVVLDKTGTITEGKPYVEDVKALIDEDEFKKLIASIESLSSHPIASSILEYAKDIELYEVDDFKTLPGKGIQGIINGKVIYALNPKALREIIDYPLELQNFIEEISKNGKTPICFGYDNKLIGVVGIVDKIKEDSINAINEMKKIGIVPIMLTGDNHKA